MIDGVPPVIVEAAEVWPAVLGAVVAGIGGAAVVGRVTWNVAARQRASDSERLDEQLKHDREMREIETRAAAERLDRQLAHDREMRDGRYLRETLTPIIGRALDWDAFTAFHKDLKQLAGRDALPPDMWKEDIAPLANRVGEVSERVRRDARALIVILGPDSPVVGYLRAIADGGNALVSLAARWKEAVQRPETFEADLDAIWTTYGFAHARLLEAAQQAVGWGDAAANDESEAARPSPGPESVVGGQ